VTHIDVSIGRGSDARRLLAVNAVSADSARIRLEEGGAREEKTVEPKVSLNWHGYHVAVIGVHADDVTSAEVCALARWAREAGVAT
jgi:hypothetical protein